MVPDSVSVAHDKRSFRLCWPNGGETHLRAQTVRANCRSASAVRERIDGNIAKDFTDVTISAIAPIGAYGLNIRFSDGHDRGIYPWGFLEDLSEQSPLAVADFLNGTPSRDACDDTQG